MKKALLYIILIGIIYIYLHNPIFTFLGGLGSIKVLYIFLFAFFLSKWSIASRLIKYYGKELSYCTLILLFVLARTAIGGDPEMVRITMVGIVEIYFLPLFILYALNLFSDYIKRPLDEVLNNSILLIGVIGSVITLMCVAIPSIGEYVKYELQYLPSDSVMNEINFRGFGVSENTTGSYGMIQGAILALGILNLNKNKWFIWFTPLVLFSILLNARTGFLFAVVGVIVYVIKNRKFKTVISLTALIAIVVVGFSYSISKTNMSDDSIQFAFGLFKEFEDVQNERSLNASYTYDALMGKGLKHPDNLMGMIVGEGYEIMGGKNGVRSDVGYSNQLYYGGIVYCIILYCLIFYPYKRMGKLKSNKEGYPLLFLFVFLIANFKGKYLINSGELRLMLFLYYTYIFYSLKSKRKIIKC